KGRKHLLRLLTEILNWSSESRGTDLSAPMEMLSRVTTRKAVAFCISDFHDAPEAFLPAVRITSRRHDVVPIIVRDPMEEALPPIGLVPFEDLETGAIRWVDTSSRSVRGAYQTRNQQSLDALLKSFRRHRVDAIHVVPGGSYDKALIQFFQLRARRL
ncbi:MAG: DUF58 domain-containing protein, partial [Myxococcota bacterium]|nr:DUF58 domain-containing protein [Myxococcota bacterium]